MSKKSIKNIFYVVAFAILIAGFIYFGNKDFTEGESALPDNEKIVKEYDLVDKNNVYTYTDLKQTLNLMKEGSGIVLICTPESVWCNTYAKLVNEVAKEQGVSKIYYLNIRNDRLENSKKYRELVTLLDDFLYRDDLDVSHLYAPELVFVKNGKIVAHDNETAISVGTERPEDYWTVEHLIAYKSKMATIFANYLGK